MRLIYSSMPEIEVKEGDRVTLKSGEEDSVSLQSLTSLLVREKYCLLRDGNFTFPALVLNGSNVKTGPFGPT